jgi:ABC-type sugar transport system ATPase subunit
MPDDAPPRLRMDEITKHFGGVQALNGVSFEARAGEVHALCGENGAGKSTLMKILAGAITDYEGRILLDGREVRFDGPRAAEQAGIRIIHQELNLVPDLSVAANVFLGREPTRALGLLDERRMAAACRRLFERLDAPISPGSKIRDLRIGDQQMVEIAKALMFEADIVIMDEPTSALSGAEVARLFRVIGDLRAAGRVVLYISHKMNEVFTLADRVTVLRDGRFVASAPRSQTHPDQVVRWMVGRELGAVHYQPHPVAETARLEVEDLSLPSPLVGRPSLSGISFRLHRGEILGVAGLLGAGRTELLEALFGASPRPPSGSVTLDGRSVRFREPAEAITAGLALVTEDRKNLGLFDRMTVAENITMGHLRSLAWLGPLLDSRRERHAAASMIARLAIKAAGGWAPVTSLSGGNQQKCVIARWLLTEPRVLLLDEPTRGIDVAAKAEIYSLMRQLAAQGMGILMTSSELPELLAVCDRILVLCEGRLTAELPRAQATEQAIMHAATRFLDRPASHPAPV